MSGYRRVFHARSSLRLLFCFSNADHWRPFSLSLRLCSGGKGSVPPTPKRLIAASRRHPSNASGRVKPKGGALIYNQRQWRGKPFRKPGSANLRPGCKWLPPLSSPFLILPLKCSYPRLPRMKLATQPAASAEPCYSNVGHPQHRAPASRRVNMLLRCPRVVKFRQWWARYGDSLASRWPPQVLRSILSK
jgi:hypothetical protein